MYEEGRGRTIGKVYGRAAARGIPAELREAIKERREVCKIRGEQKKTWGGTKRQK